MEKIASDLKASELKQVNLCKAYEALHSEASTILMLTVQWKDLDDHFNSTRKSLQEKLEELLEREKKVEAREKRFEAEDSRLEAEIGLKSRRLSEVEMMIEERGRELESSEKQARWLNLSIQEKLGELEIAVKENLAAQQSMANGVKELDQLRKDIKDRAKKLESLDRELVSVRGMLKKSRDDLDFKERQLQLIRRSLDHDRKELELREEQLTFCRCSIDDCDKEIKLREDRLCAIQGSILECSIELEKKEKKLDLVRKDLEFKKRDFVSLKKSVDQYTSDFDLKERKFEISIKALRVKETSSKSEFEELVSIHERVSKSLKEIELKEKNVASLQRSVEERFHELEKRESRFEATQKEFDSIRNTLAFRAIGKTSTLDSRVKIEQSDNDPNSDDFTSFASYGYCITNGQFLQLLLSEQLKKHDTVCSDIFSVLERSHDPAKLVLDAVQGFYPLHPGRENSSFDLGILRSGCILLMEQLMKASPAISPQVREDALKLAVDWKAKMAAKRDSFLEVLGFVQLLGSYGLASAFDADEVRSLLEVIAASRQAAELRRVLSSADEAPVNIDRAKNSRGNANITTSSPKSQSSANTSERNLELIEHEDWNGQTVSVDDIMAALQMPDPAKHVLGIVEGSFRQLWKREDAIFEARFMESYISMFEQLLKTSPHIEPQVREDALKLATEWRARIRRATTENSLEVLGFLQFLAIYGLVALFNEYEILNSLEMISRNKYALDLSRYLGCAYKIPEYIEKFVKMKRNVEAVRFILAFKLTDKFSPTKLLAEYMEDAKSYTRKFCERKNSVEVKAKVTDKEIAALNAVARCIKDYNMESQFPVETISKRIALLEKIKKDREDSALFFRSSDEQQQQQQEAFNKRRKVTSARVDQPLQQNNKICRRRALQNATHCDLLASQRTNSSSNLDGTASVAGGSSVVRGAT